MAATDRAFRALGRDEPATLLGLVRVLRPDLLPTPFVPGLLADRDPRLDQPDPSLEADAVFSDDAHDLLWHLEGQGYHDPAFLDRLLRYHLGLVLRHWTMEVHTLAIWLRTPSAEQRVPLLRKGAVSVLVTHLVLPEALASRLVAVPDTACFAPAGNDEGRGDAIVCQQTVAVLLTQQASLRRWQMAAVAARSRSLARYHAMITAMQQAGVRAVLIEDLIQIGEETGFSRGLEAGLEKGLEKGLAPLVHLFERKLGRPITSPERQTLQSRLGELGPDRLGDVVMDLAQDDLGAWLASPAR